MRGRERRQAPGGLLELALATRAVPAAGLVPGDGDVDEALEEVLLGPIRRPPRVLERLVRGEELAAPDQAEAALEIVCLRQRS